MLDRAALSATFARDRRVQVQDVLTDRTAREIRRILTEATPWGISWQAADEGPHHWRHQQMLSASSAESAAIRNRVESAMSRRGYAFLYSAYPMLDAYLEKWHPNSPHERLLEHLNDNPFLDLVREITCMPELMKADAQATLYGPGHFLTQHTDLSEEARRVAYVMNFTAEEWRPDWGGYLQFFNSEGDVVQGFRPRFNTLNLFEVPQLHSVSYVPPFSPVARYAITGWVHDH